MIQVLKLPSSKIEGSRQLKCKASKMELTITQPDDWHLHLRDGELLQAVVPHSASFFGRAIVMPNLKPPITSTAAAVAYRESILKALPADSDFSPLMTLYLTDTTSPREIKLARESGVVFAVKLYPAGATTNSQDGVTDLFGKCLPVLEEMAGQNMPLLVHGEVTDPNVDVFDREKVFIDTILQPLIQRLPQLKVVMEHITTMEAVRFVESCSYGSVAATVTPQHLLLNRNAIFQGGLQPHNYCLPVLKREIHRQAIVSAVTSGNKKFFLGTDSAPHEKRRKECACGCAGIYNAPVAISLYAKVFEEAGALDKLEAFTSFNGPDFYGLPRNTSKIKLTRTPWKVPESFSFSFGDIVPMSAGLQLMYRWNVNGASHLLLWNGSPRNPKDRHFQQRISDMDGGSTADTEMSDAPQQEQAPPQAMGGGGGGGGGGMENIPATLSHGGRFIQYNIFGNIFEVTAKYKPPIMPIGKGAYGIVCSALNSETNEHVAIKKIANAFDNKIDAKRTLREIKLLRHMDHENVVAIRDIIPPPQRESFNDVYIAYELMDTDLHQIIRSNQVLSEEHCQYFLYQILRGLKYIHSANVLHRDLKPSNLLLNANCDLKICDFGLARVTSETDFMTEYVVTRWYRAPELLLNSSDYTAAIDVWSVGCVFMELMDRKPLFPGRDHVHQLRLLMELIGTPSEAELGFLNENAKRYIRQLPLHRRQSFTEKFPTVHPAAIDLIEKMLTFDPRQRITGTRTYFCDFGSQIGGTVPSFRWGLSVSCLGKECYQHPLGSGLGHASTDLVFFLSWST
ncbi:hypothetical protein D5086_014341 [Populus alba]|uniref:Uncharacterized protein n=1 Tax=Populus alba TaxID=43335 RepID=A0ACC4BXD9_POPAL